MLASNAVLNVGAIGFGAPLARRMAGDLAGLVTVAAAIFPLVFARVAVSESAHNARVFFGMLGLLAADTARRDERGRAAALVGWWEGRRASSPRVPAVGGALAVFVSALARLPGHVAMAANRGHWTRSVDCSSGSRLGCSGTG